MASMGCHQGQRIRVHGISETVAVRTDSPCHGSANMSEYPQRPHFEVERSEGHQ